MGGVSQVSPLSTENRCSQEVKSLQEYKSDLRAPSLGEPVQNVKEKERCEEVPKSLEFGVTTSSYLD